MSEPVRIRPVKTKADRKAFVDFATESEAPVVDLKLNLRRGILHMEVRDNGRGFDMQHNEAQGGGHGLRNMRQRAAEIGGRMLIESQPGEGTRIALDIAV